MRGSRQKGIKPKEKENVFTKKKNKTSVRN